MNEEVQILLRQAAESLFQNQPNIYDFTSESGNTEWNLAHHYANEVHKLLRDYDCDLEITKGSYHNKRPDIIFHERGSHERNFLVIEVKKDGGPQDIESDYQKIKYDWFREPLQYQFGALVNLKSDKTSEVEVLENSNQPMSRPQSGTRRGRSYERR
ncbi:MAG: hypothetical protein HW388_45 [Dehalococcoidia bacterium]|nr:hypothetical protein [Dehalococcoidia bacterium]